MDFWLSGGGSALSFSLLLRIRFLAQIPTPPSSPVGAQTRSCIFHKKKPYNTAWIGQGAEGLQISPHKQNSHLCITRKLVLREEVSTDCNRVITRNFSSTHPEHQEHREWKDPVSWRSSSHSTHNSQGKNFTILLPCIFTTALFSGGSIKPSCTQDHSWGRQSTQSEHEGQWKCFSCFRLLTHLQLLAWKSIWTTRLASCWCELQTAATHNDQNHIWKPERSTEVTVCPGQRQPRAIWGSCSTPHRAGRCREIISHEMPAWGLF